MTSTELQQAGVYDPDAPDAADRLALLEWLLSHGFTIGALRQAEGEGRSLATLAADAAVRPGRRLTAAEVAVEVGLEPEQVLDLSKAAGLRVAPGEAAYVEGDFGMFRAFAVGSALFGSRPTRRFTQTVGAALSRVAEAAVTLFRINVQSPHRAVGGSSNRLAVQNVRALESLDGVQELLRTVFRAQVETAIRRFRDTEDTSSLDTIRCAIGFVDLVGFTGLSRMVSPKDLGELVERFEETANDVATMRDGRIVKVIGDEVMFVTLDPAAACDIALTLVETFADDPSITPRGAIAWGEALIRGGDYYGPVVNLSARVAQLAVPNELLVTPELANEAKGGGLRFDPAGKRMLKGFDAPVSLLTVTRA